MQEAKQAENQISKNNKKIAKNTGLLYLRMLFTMGVSLYTSRIVLEELGEINYGIYNVIGGVVVMFAFVNYAMSCATNRFMAFNLGGGKKSKLSVVFSASILIHFCIAIFIFVFAETIGLWFLNNKMTIPNDRIIAAGWVFHLSVVSTIIMVLSVPYNALIIAHEKMNIYAYVSIIESVLKLVLILMLGRYSGDKLILYAFLMLVTNLTIRVIYQIYCNRIFTEIKFSFKIERELLVDMSTYAFWSLSGSIANLFTQEGLNILLNFFFNPAVNAARGIAVQIRMAIQKFSSSFQQAMSPQINISYASGDIKYMHQLVLSSSKYSFYLLFFLSLPVLLETEFILSIWLKQVPDHTVRFVQLMIIIGMLTALANPISTAAGAHGKIRNFQLIVGGINIMVVPISYFVLKQFAIPEYVFIVQIIISIIAQIARLLLIKNMIEFSLYNYFKEVVLKGAEVTLVGIILPIILVLNLPNELFSFIIVGFSCVFSVGTAIYFIGLSKSEKEFIDTKVIQIFRK
ncbi:oligosaccharide flippase family protein [Ancylomarina sp. 16SWW S1-10-2]|uniref:oligosaccharide flippase family protein n=1 Tax=Ancylomarina sp. 16SWW S1-10-2 TaxID=2499681 RepID=UPI0012AE93E8|nr:oligosaccharide flippase family protein [Ancylomarina sp. 16SWW S1-10-2]MRT91920.1 lipopolysaccharide biosynthesis protein [Ancylomarina sp. 16SWW S1-10-2]